MKRITFYVGPNGCGKTRQLAMKAQSSLSSSRSAIAISNTPFVRFPRSRNGFQVFRVSPTGIVRVVTNNLERFFEAEKLGTFNISDLLEIIGFYPNIELEIKLGKWHGSDLGEVTSDPFEVDAIISGLEAFQFEGVVRFELSSSPDSFLRSLQDRNRIIFKYIGRLKSAKIISSYSLIFHNRQRGREEFERLSSGEQTLISTYLFIKANIPGLETIFIDEPENSLHPEWQRQYLEMLHMALGYHEARIYLATHSPVLVSGALASYENQVDVVRIDQGNKISLDLSYNNGPESVEEILWQAFDTLTPVSHFLSVNLSNMLQDFSEGRATQSEVSEKIRQFQRHSYDRKQQEVLNRALDGLSRLSPDVDAD